jgi:DNA-binding response OmpR family regulator
MEPTLLIVEDDAPLRELLVRAMRAEGFAARAVATARELLAQALAERPDALVIDIGLPDADGRDLCQALRARGVSAPVLFLTARDALTDRLSGFTVGGDDYVTKPFDIEEVVARLHALLRRAAPDAEAAVAVADGRLTLDPSQLTVSCEGRSEALTPTEFRLLAALAGRPGRAVSRQELDVYVARIRRKLRALESPSAVKTVHGLGYRLQ